MLRGVSRVCRAAAGSRLGDDTGVRCPYEVLGVSSTTPYQAVKQRFQELAQHYHPDMPHGDPNKFREINAAYRVLRTRDREQRSQRYAANPGSFYTRDSRTQHQGTYDGHETSARERQEQDRRVDPRRRHKQFIRDVLWFWQGYEMAIILGTAVAFLIIAAQRYYLVVKYTRLNALHHKAIDEGMPPPMPMEVDEQLRQRYAEPVPQEAQEVDAALLREEAAYRRATQRRFDDFREFLFVYDLEHVTSRKLSVSRFSIQHIDEALIPSRCVHVVEFNSDVKAQSFDTVWRSAAEKLETTEWRSVDAQHIGQLLVRGLAAVPANSPNTAKWTFVQYRDSRSGTRGAPAECMIAFKNNRFGRLGMCQDVTITGDPAFRPRQQLQREKALSSGALTPSDLVAGGLLPMTDVKTAAAGSPIRG